MAIGITNLGASTGTSEVPPDIRTLTDLTSYTLASWDPPDTGIVALCVFNGQNTITDVGIDSLTGNGDSWVSLGESTYSGGQRHLEIFVAFGSVLTTGVTTIQFGTDTQLFCYVSVFQITDADESGAAIDAFGLVENSGGTATSGSHNWTGSPADANSRPLYFLGHNANEAVTNPGSTTKIDDMNGAGPALGMITAWESAGFTDPSDSFTWTTSAAFGFLVAEIQMASAAPPAAGDIPPIPQVVARGRW